MSVPSKHKDLISKAYNEHADAIFRFAVVRLSHREQALDIVQETFARAWQHVSAGKEITSNIRSFLFAIAHNLIIDNYRKRKTESLDVMFDEGFDIGDGQDLPLLSVDSERALKALHQLDAGYKEVMILRFVNGFGPKEIAEVTGLTENVVSVRIHRGLERLRTILNIHG